MPEEVVVVEAEQSMDDTIRDTLRDIQSRGESVDADQDAPNAPQEAGTAATADESKARDATGKFVKTTSAPASTAATATTPIDGQTTQEAQPNQPAAAVDTALKLPDGTPIDLNRPPSSWKPAAKAEWAKLPEVVRADIHRRETEHHQGFRGIKENADFGQSMRQTVQPYMHLIQAEGGTPERAVASMLQMAALLRTGTMQQKQQIVEQTIRQYGIQMPQAQAPQVDAQGQPVQQPQQPQQFLDPRVDGLLASLQAQERERQQQAESQSNDATERFLAAKGADGQPAFPFVDNVLQDMIDRTGAIRRQNPALSHDDVLKQAYEQAVWANPETRSVLIAQQQAAAQRPEDTLRKVADAKRANANNLPKRGALPATAPKGSMDDTIRDTYRELTANL